MLSPNCFFIMGSLLIWIMAQMVRECGTTKQLIPYEHILNMHPKLNIFTATAQISIGTVSLSPTSTEDPDVLCRLVGPKHKWTRFYCRWVSNRGIFSF